MVSERRGAVRGGVALVAIGLAMVPVGSAGAWPGDPSGSIGLCGVAALDVVGGEASEVSGAAVQPDGAVLAVGSTGARGLVMRLRDGMYDTTFGPTGRKYFTYDASGRFFGVAAALGGGGVAVGSRSSASATDTVVLRFTKTGAADTGFAGNGRVTFNAGGDDSARAVAMLGDGSVVVAGDADTGGYVARYTAAGIPDTTFATTGRASNLPLKVRAIAARADGAIYVGGSTIGSPTDWRILRLGADGSVDSSFGGSDGVTVDAGGDDGITAMVLAPNGRLVVTGYGHGATHHGQTLVRRYLDTGEEDPAFSRVREAFGVDDHPSAITRQSDGKVVVAINSAVAGDNDIVLLRLNDDGGDDTTFGIDGASIMDVGQRAAVNAVVTPPGSGPIALGVARAGSRSVVGVFGFQSDSASTPPPAQGMVIDGFGGLHKFSARCLGGTEQVRGAGYWPGWDIVRGVAILPGSQGLTVDAFGGLHGFAFGDAPAAVPKAKGAPYWLGWDIVRGVAVVPEGTGGYVLDGFGGLHPFSVGAGPAPPAIRGAPYWLGFDLARGVALMPNGQGGYVVDRTGAVYSFGGAPAPTIRGSIWPALDIARGIALAPDGNGGWIVDFFGGLHPFGTGGQPGPGGTVGGPYWLGFPIARGVATFP